MNHTPGPWKVLNDSPPAVRSLNGSNVAPEVCNISDARLVAAAPELLAALYDALPYVEDVLSDPAQLACFKSGIVQRHAKAIRAAIAKAEGAQ